MHSMTVEHEGKEIYVFHNGDFSGDVIIEIDEIGYDIPFAVLKAVVGKYLVDGLISKLENFDFGDL